MPRDRSARYRDPVYIAKQKIRNRLHYLNNKTAYRARAVKQRADLVAWFAELKRTLSCSNCGFKHPAALDFHHRDPNEKDADVNTLLRHSSKAKVLAEIAKCDVLCSNCHRVLHWEGARKEPSE